MRRPASRFIAGVGLFGVAAYIALILSFGPQPWPLWPWLALIAACAILACFPYRVNRASEPYFIDFDEFLLVISILYLGPSATVAVLVGGYLLGAVARKTPVQRLVFNSGARAAAASGALALASLVPLPSGQPWQYLVTAALVAAVYTFINQMLVSMAISRVTGNGFPYEFRVALSGEIRWTWPVVVSYGLMVGVASAQSPGLLLLAGIPVALLVVASQTDQQRREEHLRTRGLYSAAQAMQRARSDQDVVQVLSASIWETLGAEGVVLREQRPLAGELGAWLTSRKLWLVVPMPSSRPERREDDAFLQALASLADASMERAALVGELRRQSSRDPLTDCFNRRYFHQALSGALASAESSPGCLALLDVDHFKSINDTFGHEVGDRTLKELVAAVSETFRRNDVLCRLGGDEFALILPGLTPTLAVTRLDSLRERLAALQPGEPERGPVAFRMSIGVAAYPEHGKEPPQLIRSADRALYRAKREGRDRVVVLDQVTLSLQQG